MATVEMISLKSVRSSLRHYVRVMRVQPRDDASIRMFTYLWERYRYWARRVYA